MHNDLCVFVENGMFCSPEEEMQGGCGCPESLYIDTTKNILKPAIVDTREKRNYSNSITRALSNRYGPTRLYSYVNVVKLG